MLNVAAAAACLPPRSFTFVPATTAAIASPAVPSIHGAPSTAPSPRLSLFFPPPLLCASPQLRKARPGSGFSAGAVKTRRKDRRRGGIEMDLRRSGIEMDRRSGGIEMDGNDDDDDDEEDEDEDEDELFVPFGEMKKWVENKPRGFGVGKEYDTSIEDKLLEEITQSRQAQAANLNKLKNAPIEPVPKKDESQLKVAAEAPSGICVRVANLPKKKNIHRDLKLAFDGTPDILSIVPAVSGNSKTRDPVCKGFAFVYFKSEKDAIRFVETFSKQNVAFGKVQKQIKCELTSPRSSAAADGESEDETYAAAASQPMDLDLEGYAAVSPEVDESFSDSWEDLSSEEENDSDNDLIEAEFEENYEDMGNLTLSELDPSNSRDLGLVSPSISSSSEHGVQLTVSTKKQERSREKSQKPSGKGNGAKVKFPKLEVPGSAKRLKIKERAVLTGVFSKYGAKVDTKPR